MKEAEGWLGNASGLLGRARQLGPHPYVTVALMPGSSTVPAVRTPFQVCGLLAPAGFNRGSTPPPLLCWSLFVWPACESPCGSTTGLLTIFPRLLYMVLLIAVSAFLQAQTFCPQFHYQHVLPIRLDPSTLTALASSDACVELWHHCPRSQAVAAALSRGLSSSYAMAGQQQVFLGSATLPLQGLLIYPQVPSIPQLAGLKLFGYVVRLCA